MKKRDGDATATLSTRNGVLAREGRLFVNPLQALFNCLVYRRWNSGSERIIIPWRQLERTEINKTCTENSSSSEATAREEIYPLLQSTPTNSINGYKSIS
ncbi:hypothetical protein NQ317_011984 [Molorchus minor]|uniref:Uncharacterized protein n=1 Tax=Molorchus minor TaxID=1323400 RepID=A0ABQ9J9Q1_9CUCU|nr:hypothetical protein NQ317_011984 [Molorchus minor]